MRTVSFDVPPQEVLSCSASDVDIIFIFSWQILSRDSVTVTVDAVVYFNVITAELALCSVDDFRYYGPSGKTSQKFISFQPLHAPASSNDIAECSGNKELV